MTARRARLHGEKPATLHLDNQWNICACSADGGAVLHSDAHSLKGKSFLDIARHPATLLQAFESNACTGVSAFSVDEVLTDLDGRDFHARMVFHPARDEAGALYPDEVAITDIDALMEAFVALSGKADLLDQVFGVVDQAFWIDRASATENIYMSPAYEAIWGEPVEALRRNGGSWAETIHPDDRDVIMRIVTARRARGLPLELEYRIIRHDGAVRWVWVKGFPVVGKSGAADIYIGTATDVTERKQQEIELARLQSTKNIGAMAADLAHNFNNILSIIELSAGNLAQLPASGNGGDSRVTTIQNAIQRGREITGALLSISSRQLLDEQLFDASDAVRKLAPLVSASLGSAYRASFDLSAEPCPINADHAGFGQAIINLVANARDAMGAAGIASGELVVRTRPAEGRPHDLGIRMVEVVVEDSGPGMSAEVLLHALDPYFTTKGKGKGTGLGLAITHGFVTQSGGRVTLENRAEGGLRVVLAFPQAGSASEGGSIVRLPTSGPKGRILVVDDEADLAEIIAEVLAGAGYAVDVATSVAAAREALEAGTFDLVLCDVMLNGNRSGEDLARWVRARHPSAALLVMSGYAADTRGGGQVPHLQKPFNQEQLLGAVQRSLTDAATRAA